MVATKTVLAVFVVSAAVLAATGASAYKQDERPLVDALLGEIRSKANGPSTVDEISDLGANLIRAFSPILKGNGTESASVPSIRFQEWEGEEAGASDDGEGDAGAHRNLLASFGGARDKITTAAHAIFANVLANWPIWVEGIWLTRSNILGGGTCSFYFESRKNWKYLPLIWKMTDAQCMSFPKTNTIQNPIRDGLGNRYCVQFRFFQKVSFTQCAPSAYWQALVSGEIVSVNPTNGATQIDALLMLQTGGLDQFLPLRGALGQGGFLDLLNYL